MKNSLNVYEILFRSQKNYLEKKYICSLGSLELNLELPIVKLLKRSRSVSTLFKKTKIERFQERTEPKNKANHFHCNDH